MPPQPAKLACAADAQVDICEISSINDEGGPLRIGFQEQILNYLKRLSSKVTVVSVEEKSEKKKSDKYGLERRIKLNHR